LIRGVDAGTVHVYEPVLVILRATVNIVLLDVNIILTVGILPVVVHVNVMGDKRGSVTDDDGYVHTNDDGCEYTYIYV
jgi:hypothetical protein